MARPECDYCGKPAYYPYKILFKDKVIIVGYVCTKECLLEHFKHSLHSIEKISYENY